MTDISLDVQDGVAVVTFDRPERLNAFRRSTYAELRTIAERLDGESAWRAAVFTGAGRAFCAGQDLQDAAAVDAAITIEAVRRVVDDIQGITRAISASSKPSLCAINGPAVGFGLEVTLACDLRFASADAYFMLPELGRGLFHTNGTYHYLQRLVGPGLASDMILTGRRVTAEEARQAGLVSRVLDREELLPAAVASARAIGGLAAQPLALARQGLRDTQLGTSLEAALEFEEASCLRLLAGVGKDG